METDDTDKKILAVLTSHARLSYRQIAKRLSLSVVTIMNRVKALEKSGAIRKYSAILDYSKIGYDIEAIIDIRVSKGRELEVDKKLAESPYVFAVYDITGEFDATVLARFPNRKRLDYFVKKLQLMPNIERTSTKLIFNTIKEEQIGVSGL